MDRFEKIKHRHSLRGPDNNGLVSDDERWLIAEVERLRDDNATLTKGVLNLAAENARLKDKLEPPVAVSPLPDPPKSQ